MSFADDVIELAFVRVGDVSGRVLARTLAMLSEEEQQRHDAFRFEKEKREYLTTRALVGEVVSRWVAGPLALLRTPAGKPFVRDEVDVQFNLTNTTDFVACAVTRGSDLGIDAEPLARGHEIVGLAETVFTVRERVALDDRGAVELWTRKEAYMKARGLGVAIEPHSFEVRALEGWSFATYEIDEHIVSICCRRRASTIVQRRVSLR